MKTPFLVIGGGLSGIAAAIRAARFTPDVLLVEKHSRIGGLNSYFYRNSVLYETGLHAITNYAEPKEKRAPLNRLFRQLKIRRKNLTFCQQYQSEVVFTDGETIRFSNDFDLFESDVCNTFPKSADKFRSLVIFIKDFDPFLPSPFRSARKFLNEFLGNTVLTDMILCPLMFYGSSHEQDMDLNQFAIMFRAIFLEGMFRPEGTIKDFLDLLVTHYEQLGGTLRKSCGVQKILHNNRHVKGVELHNGEFIECDNIVSTIGHLETLRLLSPESQAVPHEKTRLGFVETIYRLKKSENLNIPQNKTIIFYSNGTGFTYKKPADYVDFSSGVICFPSRFHGLSPQNHIEIRSTHLANYDKWASLYQDPGKYKQQKETTSQLSSQQLTNLIGSFRANIVYENTFTPITIKRYTSKIDGAIYGSPAKIPDGDIGFSNLFLAGTDQGFLGIIGSMLSGVSIVNQHVLPRL